MARVPISVCIIAKNEEKYLEDCLKKLLPYGMEIIVTDTGSTDRTVEIAKKYANKVLHFDWCDDFSAARNFCASNSSYPWILALDCDEYMSSMDVHTLRILMQKFPRYCGVIRLKNLTTLSSGEVSYGSDDVIRFYNRNFYQFCEPVHEQICKKNEPVQDQMLQTFLMPCEVIHHGYNLQPEEMIKKQERNLSLLRKMEKQGKGDSYLYFQIGQSEYILQHYEDAIAAYEKAMTYEFNTDNVYVQVMITSLAKAYVKVNRMQDAIDLLAKYEIYCRTPRYLYTYARILMDADQPIKALMYFIRITTMTDADTLGECLLYCYEHIIDIYRRMGNPEMADLFTDKYEACKREKERILVS